jgi:hypothetical protein
MKSAFVERALWSAVLLTSAACVVGLRMERVPAVMKASPLPPAAATPRRFETDSIVRATEYTIANDPFRVSRRPATVAYSSALEGLAPPPVARPPRPNFVLRGIVGGPPWSAIIDGIPGREGSVLLRKGDSVAAFVIRAVGRDSVIIKGADTTWQLTVKRP